MNSLTQDLATIVGSDGVSDDPADQSAYAHDMWPRQLLATRAGVSRPAGPRAIAWPRDREQLANILEFARKHGARVTPFGAGSAVTGAIALERDVIAIDTKRMRSLHEVDLERGIAVADAGMLGEHLEQQLQRKGATLGHFPSSIYCSTLGGWIATRSAGQCSGRYGKIEDMVLSIDGVLGSGDPFTCGPPKPGQIDARALMVGSEGLFGFITRATMRIWPAPTERQFASLSFATMKEAWLTIRALFQSGLRPAVARIYDPFDTYIFKTGGRSHAPRTESAGRKRPYSEFVLRRLLKLVGPLNKLNERFGEAVFGRSLLVLMFEGTAGEGLEQARQRALKIGMAQGGRDEGEAYGRRWLARRHAVSYRQPPTYARGLWADTMEVAAPWSKLEALYHEVHAALGSGGFVMAHMSHAYPDGCSIYFTFAGASPDDSQALAVYSAMWARALEAAHRAGGTISHHHGVGRSKRRAMRLELGAGVNVIDALTDAADPGTIMARGPLVPPAHEGPSAPLIPAPSADVVLDADSRLATLDARAPLSEVVQQLTARGFTLPPDADAGTARAWLGRGPTVREWLAARPCPAVLADPVDHLVAGYTVRLPSGAIAHTLPAPRRAAGPELFALFAQDKGRLGQLRSVTIRVHEKNERLDAWTAPVAHPATDTDPAITAWLERVRPG